MLEDVPTRDTGMVYNNVEKSHDNDTVKETNPQLMYKEVKDELMRFAETAMEKRVRVRKQMTRLRYGSQYVRSGIRNQIHMFFFKIGVNRSSGYS